MYQSLDWCKTSKTKHNNKKNPRGLFQSTEGKTVKIHVNSVPQRGRMPYHITTGR